MSIEKQWEDSAEDKPLLAVDGGEDQNKKDTFLHVKHALKAFIILCMQFSAFTADTACFAFFPNYAIKKKLTHFQIGMIFSSFDLSRFLTSPIFGSLVSD